VPSQASETSTWGWPFFVGQALSADPRRGDCRSLSGYCTRVYALVCKQVKSLPSGNAEAQAAWILAAERGVGTA